MKRIVVVGSSVAGVHAAEALRDQGFDGDVTLVSAEDHAPYDRPPLSKGSLVGDVTDPELLLRPESWYVQQDLELLLGQPAVGLDTANGSVVLANGTTLPYDGLVLATGSSALAPRGIVGDSDCILSLRTLSDCAALRRRLVAGTRLVVIGGGFIGLELAATACRLGVAATVVEVAPEPLAPVLGREVGSWFRRLHERHGVTVRTGSSVQAVQAGAAGIRVNLADGDMICADTVVAGVGAAPATGWLRNSGVELVDGGVRCDRQLRTSVPNVVAAGDIACWYNELYDEFMRIEHWTNAVEQGRFAAASLLGADHAAYVGPPYFWTDQYDVGTRTVGRVSGADRVSVQYADDASLVALYGRGTEFRGAVCANAPRALLAGRRALSRRLSWADALAAVEGLTSATKSVRSLT